MQDAFGNYVTGLQSQGEISSPSSGTGGSGSVILSAGNPEGVESATGPAIAITAAGDVYIKPDEVTGTTGWNQILDAP